MADMGYVLRQYLFQPILSFQVLNPKFSAIIQRNAMCITIGYVFVCVHRFDTRNIKSVLTPNTMDSDTVLNPNFL
jgi:hypothetical protein